LLEARIPRIRIPTGKSCTACKGKRVDPITRTQKCFDCSGTGKGYIFDWKGAEALSATLSVFTTLAQLFEYETYGKNTERDVIEIPQLITLQTITRRGAMHGGSLGGSYSTDMISWLSRAELTTIPEAIDAMQATWARMWKRVTDFEKRHSFRAGCYHHPQQLLIDCPGNACGLHQGTDFDFKGNAGGYDFECHNVDSPAQQLTLITALAAIEDRARRELKLEIRVTQ